MLKRDAGVTFAGNLASLALATGASLVFAGVLGPDNRGLLALALLLPNVVAAFARLGQEAVNITFAGLYKEHRSSLFLQSILLSVLGGLLSVLVICAFHFWLPIERGQFAELSTRTIWLSCLVAPALIMSVTIIGLVAGVGRIGAAAVMRTLRSAALLVGAVVFVIVFKYGVNGAVFATALASFVAVIVSVYVLRDYATLRPSRFSGWLFKKSVGFGGQVGIATFATFLVYRIDQAMLGYMVPLHELGFYTVAVGLAERVKLLPTSIATAFLPRLANDLAGRQSHVPAVFRYALITSFISMLAVGVLAVPMLLLILPKYTGSIPAFLILLPGIVALGGSSVLASDAMAREKPKYSVWTGYSMLVVKVLLNLILIPRMGIAGAALAASATYVLACMLWLWIYRVESGRPLVKMIPTWNDVMYIVRSAAKTLKARRMRRSAAEAGSSPSPEGAPDGPGQVSGDPEASAADSLTNPSDGQP